MKLDKNEKLFSINDILKVKELLSEILIGNDKTMTINAIDNVINDVIDNKKRKFKFITNALLLQNPCYA